MLLPNESYHCHLASTAQMAYNVLPNWLLIYCPFSIYPLLCVLSNLSFAYFYDVRPLYNALSGGGEAIEGRYFEASSRSNRSSQAPR